MRGLATRIDDLLNPIVVKELRQAVQGRFVSVVFLLFLAVQLCVMGGYVFMSGMADQTQQLDFEPGMGAFGWLQGILLSTTILFVPIYTGVRLGAERSDDNVDLMFVTTLRPRSIITGKLAAAALITLMIFSACAPFMAFTYLLRGIDLYLIFLIIILDFFIVLVCVQFLIFLAVLTSNRVAKIMIGILGLGALLIAWYCGLASTEMMIFFGPSSDTEAYAIVGSTSAALLLATGIMFTWSVGLISPLSANRTLPSRIFTLASLVIGGIICVVWGLVVASDIPIAVWVIGASCLISISILIAINEREEWSPRIKRTIPRLTLLRVPLFLFYSGGGGGILFSLALAGATVAAVAAWRLVHGVLGSPFGLPVDEMMVVCKTMAIIVLYVYCYSMTAVLLRSTLLRSWFTREFTWVVALLLFVIGSAVPFVIAFVALQGDYRYYDHIFVLLGNPFVAAIEVAKTDSSYPEYGSLFFVVAIGWAALVSILNMPWLIRQMLRFRPLKKKEAEPVEEPAARESADVVMVEPLAEPRPIPVAEGAQTSVQDLSAMS